MGLTFLGLFLLALIFWVGLWQLIKFVFNKFER